MKTVYLILGVMLLFGCGKLKETGSIAGKVTSNGVAVSGVKVVALSDSLTPNQTIDYSATRFDFGTDSNGNFKIELVDPGEYFVIAWQDNGIEWKYEDSLDAIGFYKGKVSVAKKENKTGINIDTLYITNP